MPLRETWCSVCALCSFVLPLRVCAHARSQCLRLQRRGLMSRLLPSCCCPDPPPRMSSHAPPAAAAAAGAIDKDAAISQVAFMAKHKGERRAAQHTTTGQPTRAAGARAHKHAWPATRATTHHHVVSCCFAVVL